jgi:hypothetical protein
MGEIPEEAIRMRAYHIWEREGRPEGRDLEHWIQARIELTAEVVPVQPQRSPAAAPPQQARSNGGKSSAQKSSRSGARPARARR